MMGPRLKAPRRPARLLVEPQSLSLIIRGKVDLLSECQSICRSPIMLELLRAAVVKAPYVSIQTTPQTPVKTPLRPIRLSWALISPSPYSLRNSLTLSQLLWKRPRIQYCKRKNRYLIVRMTSKYALWLKVYSTLMCLPSLSKPKRASFLLV